MVDFRKIILQTDFEGKNILSPSFKIILSFNKFTYNNGRTCFLNSLWPLEKMNAKSPGICVLSDFYIAFCI